VGSLVAGGILWVLAIVFLVGGGWVLWQDRVERDGDGFVSIGTNDLQTETYAIVGELRGDGPRWLWGSTVLGDGQVTATSGSQEPLFVGIARDDDIARYLNGAGYSTIEHFTTSASTTHMGHAPTGPPSRQTIWAASTEGTGEQTLVWTPRSGDWSIVFMNADASAPVELRGDVSAELPLLPWLAGGLLVAAGICGFIGGWLLVRANRRTDAPPPPKPDESHGSTAERVPVGAHS
jgi:hypothetical protein